MDRRHGTTHRPRHLAPDFYTAMVGLEKAIHRSGIDPIRYELIKIRASQINGCAYCLDMHLRDTRRGGEIQRRLDIVYAWREATSFFSDAKRAALALTEETTLIADDGVPDVVWDAAVDALGEKGVAQVLMAVVAINGANPMAVSTHQDLPSDP